MCDATGTGRCQRVTEWQHHRLGATRRTLRASSAQSGHYAWSTAISPIASQPEPSTCRLTISGVDARPWRRLTTAFLKWSLPTCGPAPQVPGLRAGRLGEVGHQVHPALAPLGLRLELHDDEVHGASCCVSVCPPGTECSPPRET